MPQLVLASASPARLATLRAAGLDPRVVVSGVDESVLDGLPPAELAVGLARLKAEAVAGATDLAEPLRDDALVLGCDSVLDLDGTALGKPADAADATARWRGMRGRTGVLRTGHCLLDRASDRMLLEQGATVVRFAEVEDAEIDAYVATGEPLHVAGAFTLDGLGGGFVAGVEGDPHNVVGVSLPLLRRMVRELGHSWVGLWR